MERMKRLTELRLAEIRINYKAVESYMEIQWEEKNLKELINSAQTLLNMRKTINDFESLLELDESTVNQ